MAGTKNTIRKTDKNNTKNKKEKKEEELPVEVVEEQLPVDEETLEDESDDKVSPSEEVGDSSEKKKRTVPTKESIMASFDEIITLVENEITNIRNTNTKTKGIKFLRTLNKKVKTLRAQSSRVIKQRNTNKTTTRNTSSGFLKPVKISKEMAKFTGWDQSELKSRVAVTKYICDYIKENNLQNPSDRRQILPDAKLQKLLKFDPKNTKEDLTYYKIQTYIKPHFMSETTA